MKKFVLFVFIFCYGVITACAQDSQGGIPPSFELKNISQDIDLVQVQPPDMAMLVAEDIDRAAKSEPYRTGVTLPVDFSINNSGTWTEVPGQNANIWRLTVKSEGAKAIGFGYASFYLPDGAKLFLYNKDRSMVIGAYTSQNNSDNYYFVNEKIKGDEITLELFLPNDMKKNVFLHITELNYFYRQPETSMAKLSGSCEVNVICSPEGDNWQDEKKGVCLIDIKNGSYWFNCTGSLVNNTSQNCTPYVLLADHCHYYSGYPSTADYNSWIFNFHYESTTCSGTTASGTFSKTGCTLKAHDTYGQNDVGSDFCLVQISSAITQDVYYNGWDRNNTASTSGVGIHHPDADIMKISTYTSALTSYNYGGTGTHWRVVWAATTNGHGVTEQGSSGSPIFNSTGKIVGTLTGGSSYCSTPTNPDYYGKVYYHWDQNGTTADKRLKDWLDPTNTGATSLAGMASCSSCTPPTTQATSFTSSSITNTSMTVGWTRGNGTGGVIVVARAGSAVNANPVNGTTYTASATFGSGTQIGTANYVVYKGTGTSVTVTGLSAGTAYYYAVYEYNTTGTCYKTPALTGNATTTGSSGTTCDTLTNILPTDTLTLYGFGGSNWGTWTGHNSYSFSEFAEHYTGVTSSSISGLEVFVGTAFSGATGGNHKVTFNVYQGGTTPGTVLGSTDVALTALNDYAINYITFPSPVAFTGTDVYVGYTIYYNSPADTFNVAQTTSSLTNSGFIKYGGTWYSFPAITGNALVSAIYVSPIICTGCTLPGAAGTISGSPSVCQGQNNVSYTVPAITDATSYIWSYSGTGATISGTSNSVSISFSSSATSGNLTVMGTNACGNGTVSANYPVTVNPTPTVSVPANISVCNNGTVAATSFTSTPAGGTFTWTNSNTAIGLAASGSGNIASFTATNTGTAAISATITVTPTLNNCAGTPSSYTITVKPTPTATVPANISVCNNGTVSATSFTSTPAGGTFTWTNSNTAIGLAASGSGNIASFTATNTGTTSISATVAVTPTVNGCAGTPASYTITVKPTPMVTVPANISVCNNGTVSATSFTSTPAGGTFTWTNSNTAIGLTASGSGNITAFTAVNTGTAPISATITVTPTVNGCAGTPASYTITVKPTPTVTVPANISVCNNGTVAATSFTTTPAGGTLTWTNSNTAIGLAASGSGNIAAFTATNTGTAPISATITVTPTVNGCAGTPASYTITVKPTPTVTVPANIVVCENSTVAATNFTSTPAGGTFTWTNSNTAIGLAAAGSGNIAAFTAANSGTTPILAIIAVTPTVNGCAGTPTSYTITVNPLPTAEAGANATYTGTPVQIGDPSNGPGTFSWSPVAGLNNPAIAAPLASPTVSTTYTLTVVNNNCTATDAVTITIGSAGHNITGKTRYAAKANAGYPAPNPATYNSVIYNIDQVIVILKTSGGAEIARDTSDALGNYYITNIPDGNYILSYDKYTADSMQWCNDVNAIDLALIKYYIGSDTVNDPSRNFYPKYRKAANVDNNTAINAIDISRMKAKIGSPYNVSKNFPKGNWVALDTSVTIAGADINLTLKTISYGDYNASSTKYRDSLVNWNMTKSLPENIITVSDDYITTSDPSYFEVPLYINADMDDFSALGLELKYPDVDYKLLNVFMSSAGNKKADVKINPSLEEILSDDNDLLVTDEEGIIRVVYATTDHFDVAAHDEMIRFGFRSVKSHTPGELDFSLSGTGVIGDQYGREKDNVSLVMPKIFVQGNNTHAGFELSGYPNPFSDKVTLFYNIPEEGNVSITVYNSLGETVLILKNETQQSGRHLAEFSGKYLSSGIYTIKLDFTGQHNSGSNVLKMIR